MSRNFNGLGKFEAGNDSQGSYVRWALGIIFVLFMTILGASVQGYVEEQATIELNTRQQLEIINSKLDALIKIAVKNETINQRQDTDINRIEKRLEKLK